MLYPKFAMLPVIIMRHFYLFIFILAISCSNSSRVEKIDPTIINNIAVINYDSCRKWYLPLTSFKVEYPDNYKALFHPKNDYLELRKYSDTGYIEQEFSFGKSQNIQTKEEIEEWIYKIDSAFNSFKTYQTKFIGYRKIANMNLFLVNSLINFDSFGQADYKGDYRILMMIIPTEKQPNGVSVSVLTKSTVDSIKNAADMNKILKTLEFNIK